MFLGHAILQVSVDFGCQPDDAELRGGCLQSWKQKRRVRIRGGMDIFIFQNHI